MICKINSWSKFNNLMQRSTIAVPANGYVVLRFKADNPGIWLMHCHTNSHMLEGMATLLDVSDNGIPPVPPNFPTCPVHTFKSDYSGKELVPLSSIGTSDVTLVDKNSANETKAVLQSLVILQLLSFFLK